MGYADQIETALVAAQCAPVALSDKEVWNWQQQWRRVYAGQLHAETGKWVEDEFDWHLFVRGRHVHKKGDAAWAAYRRLEPSPFLVLSAYIHKTFGFTCTGKPPERLDRGIDIVVAPQSMEWTMAFDHEHYGPFWAIAR
jgi:hypothetical protein